MSHSTRRYVTSTESANYEAWAEARTKAWGRLVGPQGTGPPVWVSEFGVNHWSLPDASDGSPSPSSALQDEPRWWAWFSKYVSPGGLRADGVDFAYWQLGGTQVGGTSRRKGAEETYGVLNQCWTAPASWDHLRAIAALTEYAD